MVDSEIIVVISCFYFEEFYYFNGFIRKLYVLEEFIDMFLRKVVGFFVVDELIL